MIKDKHIKITISIVSLLCGCFFYLIYRSKSTILYMLIDTLGLSDYLTTIRTNIGAFVFCDFIMFNLTDLIWSFAYILFVDALIYNFKYKLIIASIIPIIGVLSELLQYNDLVSGTFDPLDIFCYIIPYVSYLLIQLLNIDYYIKIVCVQIYSIVFRNKQTLCPH